MPLERHSLHFRIDISKKISRKAETFVSYVGVLLRFRWVFYRVEC
ncbi:hypothetical protein APHWEB_1080 [Anaplasma phagocytophilum str. Webster]|nr:hypothetical protein APHWEB_1079 [Anaplasma phagocytophilum str. Webster]KJV59856.1 hypothetical protein APHWEB_1080 [Anaplasma phagocytophilum str. Webster]